MRHFLVFAALVLATPALAQVNYAPGTGTSAGGYGVRDDSTAAPAAGGTGNAVGDVLTLSDGCTTHATLAVNAVSTGAVTSYNVTGHGNCAYVPANPVGVLSTTGSGSGATFTLAWGSMAAGILSTPALAQNNGNLFITGTPPQYYSGSESNFIGYRAGLQVGSGNFNWVSGHNAAGSGAGCASLPIYLDSSTITGTDDLRNTCGNSQVDLYGDGILKNYNQAGTAANHYLWGTAAFGAFSLFYWNAPVAFPWNSAFGADSCQGASTGTVSFTNGTCVGSNTGKALTTANDFLILAGGGGTGVVGSTTFASGTGVILIGSGYKTVDTPAAGTNYFLNIENALIATTTLPGYGSGFGSNAGAPGGAGASSLAFPFNVGTGGAASTGVITFPSAAPNGWYCTGIDKTNPASYEQVFTPNSTTSVTVTNYSRTTGTVTPWTSGDQLLISCNGY